MNGRLYTCTPHSPTAVACRGRRHRQPEEPADGSPNGSVEAVEEPGVERGVGVAQPRDQRARLARHAVATQAGDEGQQEEGQPADDEAQHQAQDRPQGAVPRAPLPRC